MLLSFILVLVQYGLDMIKFAYSNAIISLIFFSFWAALIVVHHNTLARAWCRNLALNKSNVASGVQDVPKFKPYALGP